MPWNPGFKVVGSKHTPSLTTAAPELFSNPRLETGRTFGKSIKTRKYFWDKPKVVKGQA
jgi:hypothetical protein